MLVGILQEIYSSKGSYKKCIGGKDLARNVSTCKNLTRIAFSQDFCKKNVFGRILRKCIFRNQCEDIIRLNTISNCFILYILPLRTTRLFLACNKYFFTLIFFQLYKTQIHRCTVYQDKIPSCSMVCTPEEKNPFLNQPTTDRSWKLYLVSLKIYFFSKHSQKGSLQEIEQQRVITTGLFFLELSYSCKEALDKNCWIKLKSVARGIISFPHKFTHFSRCR